jgi:hypothetical protein
MHIDLCFQVFKFEKRFRYVLSSINQQIKSGFTFHIKVAINENQDQYINILKQSVIAHSNLDISLINYTDDKFKFRGQTRTDNIVNCKSDCILFLDADNVFHPSFFNELYNHISHIKDIDTGKVISVPRLTMDAKKANLLINSDLNYSSEVLDVYNKVSKIPTKPSYNYKVSGAGYFQLVFKKTLVDKHIYSYTNNIYDTSILNENVKFCTKSDIVFRKKLDGVYPITTLKPIIHINHFRRALDKDYNFNNCN